jgi:hypothetical protein
MSLQLRADSRAARTYLQLSHKQEKKKNGEPKKDLKKKIIFSDFCKISILDEVKKFTVKYVHSGRGVDVGLSVSTTFYNWLNLNKERPDKQRGNNFWTNGSNRM